MIKDLLPARRSAAYRTGFALYALHMLLLFRLAASNVVLGLTVLSTPWSLDRRSFKRPGVNALLAALAGYVVCLLTSVVASTSPRASFPALSELFSLGTLVLGLAFIEGEREARRLVDGLCLLAVLLAGSGLFQFLLGYGGLDNRIRGPFSHYMTFSGVLLIADLLLFARLAHRDSWKKPWLWVGLAILNVALFGSLTRSAMVALVAALGLLVMVRAPRLLLVAPLAALVLLLVMPLPVLHRMQSIFDVTDESNYDRLCMARAGLTMIAERPLFGIGPDQVKERYPLYRHPTAPRYTVPHLHSTFLELAAERGVPALASYLAMMAVAIGWALRRFVAEGGMRGPRADLTFGTALALVGFNLAGLFENNWGDTEVQRITLFVLALPFVVAEQGDEAPAEP